MRRARCLLVSDQPLVLYGLRSILELEFDIHSCPGDRAIIEETILSWQPAAVIIDRQPLVDGRLLGNEPLATVPSVAIIYLTEPDQPNRGEHSFEKTRPAEELIVLLRTVIAVAPPDTSAVSNDRARRVGDGKARLSNRERQVLSLLVRGHSMGQVASQLGITPRTVAFHKYRLMETNQLKNNADLISFCIREGLLLGAAPSFGKSETQGD